MDLTIVRGRLMSANCFIITEREEKKFFVIDLGLSGKLMGFPLRKTLERISDKRYDEYELEVFLTHCHVDHIHGEDNLKKFPHVTFSASSITAQHINARDNVTLLAKYFARISFTVEKTYQHGDKITFGDREFLVIAAPGHTDGSTVLFEPKSKSLFAGDVIFDGTCGRTDFPSGSTLDMMKTLDHLATYDIHHLYSGHGEDLHHNVIGNIRSVRRMFEMW